MSGVHLARRWKSWSAIFKRRHPEVRFTACPKAILAVRRRGKGLVAWNWSHDWGWEEQGVRRKGSPKSVSAKTTIEAHPLQYLLLWFTSAPASGTQEQCRALYLHLTLQHWVSQTSGPWGLFAASPGEHSPTSPLSTEYPPPSPQQSFEMTGCCPKIRAATCQKNPQTLWDWQFRT